jgi:hypothetical protein
MESTKIDNAKALPTAKKDCVICLEEFKNGDDVITLPCLHIYHKTCITDWLLENNTCPICKHVIKSEDIH